MVNVHFFDKNYEKLSINYLTFYKINIHFYVLFWYIFLPMNAERFSVIFSSINII